MKYPLTAVPSLIFPIAIYAVTALLSGGHEALARTLDAALFSIDMPAGVDWSLTFGEVFVVGGLVALFADLIKATGTQTATLLNHIFSVAVFIGCLVFFLLAPVFVTSPFFLLMMMALLDVVAGFTITIISARRDVAFD